MAEVRCVAGLPPAAIRLLEGAGESSLFLQPRWLEAMGRAYPRLRPAHLILEESGEVTGVVPLLEKRVWGLTEVVSNPFGSCGGPVLSTAASRGGLRALLEAFHRRARRRGDPVHVVLRTRRWSISRHAKASRRVRLLAIGHHHGVV